MKTSVKLSWAVMFLTSISSALADETFDVLPVGSVTYTNVTITDVTVTDVYFTYPGGMGNAKLKDLSPALQEHFHYNQANAVAVEDKQTKANIQYQALAAQRPLAHPADESRLPDSTPTQTDGQWGTDLPAALNQARSQNKLVLMDFTGSDWCPWCIKMDHETLAAPQFMSYAADKLVLVRLDFPHSTPQSDDLKRANQDLQSRYNVNGFPSLVLLDASGRELGRQVGYLPGGPDAFIAKLDGFSKK